MLDFGSLPCSYEFILWVFAVGVFLRAGFHFFDYVLNQISWALSYLRRKP